jgi:hypothetical protein
MGKEEPQRTTASCDQHFGGVITRPEHYIDNNESDKQDAESSWLHGDTWPIGGARDLGA